MRKIVVLNQKGGVAKTTTSINLSAELARYNNRVLLIDLDPQGSATSAIFGNDKFEKTLYDVIVDECPLGEVMKHSAAFGIDVIPSDITLSGAPMRIAQRLGRERILLERISYLDYDYLIIDAPPSLDLLTINALTACNELIIPICPEYFSLKGIKILEEVIDNVRNGLKTEIKLLGVLITRFRHRVIMNEAKKAISDYFGDKLFDSVIPENIKIEEAHNAHFPICKYDPSSKGALAYENLVKEVINGTGKSEIKTEITEAVYTK